MSVNAIGIDLGTITSCVAIYDENIKVIENENGYLTTPSCVTITGEKKIVGNTSKEWAKNNNSNTIIEIKRLMGRNYDDPIIKDDIANMPYEIVNVNNKPCVKIDSTIYHPEQISAMILDKMKNISLPYLNNNGEKINAVITVPAYFNNKQRQATKDAGEIAGLNVIRVINEPTAAAMAYGIGLGLGTESDIDMNILVFDYGGGTHDVSLLSISSGIFTVLATAGDTHLGGVDIDMKMVKWCINDIKKRYGVDIKSNRSIDKLRVACENAKKILSSSQNTRIIIDALYDGIDYMVNISRIQFENLCGDIFAKTMNPVYQVLSDSKLAISDIDEIILVGGSTRIPKIREKLSNYFGKTLNHDINPDEAVARGAAIQAKILCDKQSELSESTLLIDVTPLSLGVETFGGEMSILIKRNTKIPHKKTKIFSTYADNQTSVTIKIFEGERKFTAYNNLLGKFNLANISPAPRAIPKIEVTLSIDCDGILTVSAIDKTSGKDGEKKSISITRDSGNLSASEINKLILDAEEHRVIDITNKARIDTINRLDTLARHIMNIMSNEFRNNENSLKINELLDKCKDAINFVSVNKNAAKNEYEIKLQEINDIWNPMAIQLFGDKKN